MNEWEKYYQLAQKKFQNHTAILIQDSDRFTIIDFRNRDGRVDYYINFIVDKKRGSLIVSGDLGDSIATWFNPIEIKDLKRYIYKDIPYYMSKFQCTTDDYYYDEEYVFECLIDGLFGAEDGQEERIEDYVLNSSYSNVQAFKDELMYEVRDSIRNNDFIPTDRLYEMATDVYQDAWELFNKCGAQIDGRVYLWAIGFYMACSQLNM